MGGRHLPAQLRQEAMGKLSQLAWATLTRKSDGTYKLHNIGTLCNYIYLGHGME